MNHHKIIQVHLSDGEDLFLNKIYFAGDLKSSDTLINTRDAAKRLGYGDFQQIARNRTPSIEINPSKDILYLSLRLKDLPLFIRLFEEFFAEAKFIAMDTELGVGFLDDILPNHKFHSLEKIFLFPPEGADSSTQGSTCQGILGLDVRKQQDAFDRGLRGMGSRVEIWVARKVLLPGPCSHYPNIRPCRSNNDDGHSEQSS